jgi:tetratricopeptide (TPR) repeat protein
MELIPSMGLDQIAVSDQSHRARVSGTTERLMQLSSWMIVLGTIRLVCTVADDIGALFELSRGEAISFRLLGRFFQENHPVVAISAVWPLLLALSLRRTRWMELLKAAAATFLILSIGGVMELTAEWNHTVGTWLTIGSFHIPRRVLVQPTLAGACLCVLGMSQLALELAAAIRALALLAQLRPSRGSEVEKDVAARRSRFGRLAIYMSLAYLAVMIRLPLWSTYLQVLNQSSFVREYILQNDFRRIHTRRTIVRALVPDRLTGQMQTLTSSGQTAWNRDEFEKAREDYLRAISLADFPTSEATEPGFRAYLSTSLNNLAWLLATCPDPKLRDPQGAVKFARRAVEVSPQNGDWWNTLGVAYYRAGEWEESKKALYRSMELRNDGDSFDWFFLGLVHFKLGHKERAREWYDKAVGWVRQIEKEKPYLYEEHGEELYRFHSEAAREMGLDPPSTPPPAKVVRQQPFASPLIPITKRMRLRAGNPIQRPRAD